MVKGVKKMLATGLALVLVFAAGTSASAANISANNADPSKGVTVHARQIVDTAISASITYGDMDFLYTEATRTWTAEGAADSNSIRVENMSASRNINVNFSYADTDTGNANAFKFFASDPTSVVRGTPSGGGGAGTATYEFSSMAPGGNQTTYAMFTSINATNVPIAAANDGDTIVGTVTVAISNADAVTP